MQSLQNKVLRTIVRFARYTLVRNLHTASNLKYIYDYITKLCRKQAKVMRIHENEHVRIKEQVKPDIENVRRLHLPVVKLTTVQATKLPLYHKIRKIGMICFAKPVEPDRTLLYSAKAKIFNSVLYVRRYISQSQAYS
jgi:ribosomal 50S subunit-associated protein YjgA (DUF615 family)